MKYVMIRRADGGKQRAIRLASGKLRFVKNSGGASAPRKAAKKMAKRRKSSTALARRSSSPRRRRYHLAKMPRRSRKRHSAGGIASTSNIVHVGGATLGLAYLLGPKSPFPSMRTHAEKIPGAKTIGIPAAVGIAALATDRFLYKNKWLKLAGVAGVVLAAARIGEAGTDFKWVGDDDVAGDFDDVGDDVGDDDVGDDVGDEYE
jgi:hypothetical protein